MHRLHTLIVLVSTVVVLSPCSVIIGCSSMPRLTDQEKAKIHPQLQRLLAGDKIPDLDDISSLRPDGSREYPLIVRMSKPEELATIGISPQSRFGEILTVRATPSEILSIARLSSVTSVEPGTRNEPHSSID